MDTGSILAVFMASILGSTHCAAMCGGLAGFCSASSSAPKTSLMAYHLGRGISYGLLGGLAGILGASINSLSGLQSAQSFSMLLVGIIFLSWGLYSLGTNKTPKPLARISFMASQRLSRILKQLRERKSTSLIIGLVTGLLTVFLPCGWLYAFVLVAAASGSVGLGALLMVAFWLGSIPSLVLVSAGFQLLSPSLRRYAPRLGACLLLLAGLSSIFARDSLMSSLTNHNIHANHSDPNLTSSCSH